MRYIASYYDLTTIVDANSIEEAKTVVSKSLYDYQHRYKAPVSKNEIIFNLQVREATQFDEEWYKIMSSRI